MPAAAPEIAPDWEKRFGREARTSPELRIAADAIASDENRLCSFGGESYDRPVRRTKRPA